jgi:ABC-type bacteriocin/lantibiotic exporter with double-glycine peptidase domain
MTTARSAGEHRPLLTATLGFLTRSLGVPMSPDDVDRALRRAARAGDCRFPELVGRALGGTGVVAAVVHRPLGDVLDDADPSFPWLAFTRAADGSMRGVAVLSASVRRARVAVLGVESRPTTWSRASLRAWLGVPDDRTAVPWVVAEATASLTPMRSADGQPRLEPHQRLRALLVGERRTLWIAVVYSVVIGLLSLVAPIAVQSLVNTIAFSAARQPLLVLTVFVLVALPSRRSSTPAGRW